MSVVMTFYSDFIKRENSTKRPIGGRDYDVVFKDNFSILGGTVKLQANFGTVKNYTAAKYENYYYKVVDVISMSNGIVEIIVKLDVLATYKSDIASYTSMIERSPDDKNIVSLVDNTISPIANNIRTLKTANVYSIGVCFQLVTKNGQGDLAYFLDLEGFNNLLTKFEAAFWVDETKYITSLKTVPIAASRSGGTASSDVYIGQQNYNITSGLCYAVKSQSYVQLAVDTVNMSDIVTTYTDERRYNNNYVNLQCKLNGDVIDLDSNFLRYDSFITASYIDPITLDVRLEIEVKSGTSNYLIASTNTNIGVGTSFNDVPNAIENIVSSMSGFHKSFASAVVTSYKAGMVVNTAGTPSGSSIAAVMYGDIVFYITEFESIEKNPNELGYPYMEVTSINAVNKTGFYKFAKPQIGIAALADVKSSVNGFLLEGIFYE